MRTLHLHILCEPQPDSVVPALVHSPAGRDACTAAQTRSVLETAGITETAAADDERHGKNLTTSLGWRAAFARRSAPESAERACRPVAPRVYISACRWGGAGDLFIRRCEGDLTTEAKSVLWRKEHLRCDLEVSWREHSGHVHVTNIIFAPSLNSCRWGKRQKVNNSAWCLVTGLVLKGHRWEPATLISPSLATPHNYHI